MTKTIFRKTTKTTIDWLYSTQWTTSWVGQKAPLYWLGGGGLPYQLWCRWKPARSCRAGLVCRRSSRASGCWRWWVVGLQCKRACQCCHLGVASGSDPLPTRRLVVKPGTKTTRRPLHPRSESVTWLTTWWCLTRGCVVLFTDINIGMHTQIIYTNCGLIQISEPQTSLQSGYYVLLSKVTSAWLGLRKTMFLLQLCYVFNCTN